MITYTALRERYLQDTVPGSSGATPTITRALEQVGWQSVGESNVDEMADYLVHMFDDCVHTHRDPSALAYAIADVMRDAGPLLDGGLPPVEAYLPAAEELLRLYVRNE